MVPRTQALPFCIRAKRSGTKVVSLKAGSRYKILVPASGPGPRRYRLSEPQAHVRALRLRSSFVGAIKHVNMPQSETLFRVKRNLRFVLRGTRISESRHLRLTTRFYKSNYSNQEKMRS